jgi:ActR/RegA family two-component response regulator
MLAANNLKGTSRPCVILAHPDSKYTASVSRSFRRLPWQVHLARTADEVRQLARANNPELVVLSTDLAGESGWLTCEKLRTELPGIKVVLVTEEPTAYLERFAQFVGASALLSIYSAPAALLDLVGQPAVV